MLIDEGFPFCRLPCLYDTAAELASYVLQGELSFSFQLEFCHQLVMTMKICENEWCFLQDV